MGPGKKKNGNKRDNPESAEGKRPGDRQPPAMAERTDQESSVEPASTPPVESHEQVTNQDEQEKITNADDRDTPIAEN